MNSRALLIGCFGCLLVSGAAMPALAQVVGPGEDPIGDVLSGLAGQQGMDDDAAESGDGDETPIPAGPAPRPAAPAPTPPTRPWTPPEPQPSGLPSLQRPVMIDELGRTPEAPPTPTERAYESRIKSGFSAAQGRQGPLDGEWILRERDGRSVYSLIFVDKGNGALTLEGAWRNMRPGQPVGRVGLIDSVEKTTSGLSVRFVTKGARDPVVLTLTPSGAEWTGEMWEAGSTHRVTMRRN